MKKYNGFLIIAISIIIAALLISISIYIKSVSSIDHCYEKVYKSELEVELRKNEIINKKLLDEGKPKSTFFTKKRAKAEAAKQGRRSCLR